MLNYKIMAWPYSLSLYRRKHLHIQDRETRDKVTGCHASAETDTGRKKEDWGSSSKMHMYH